jgi:hypothetical protein
MATPGKTGFKTVFRGFRAFIAGMCFPPRYQGATAPVNIKPGRAVFPTTFYQMHREYIKATSKETGSFSICTKVGGRRLDAVI